MAKFLNTSATNYYLEEMIKGAMDRLILISPFLKLNDRVKELLEDKNRLKIDVRIVYGKSELHPNEINWLRGLTYIRTSFCRNLHAKCYLNESSCIISSLNLYEFSQINNNEIGVFIDREQEPDLYRDAYDEAQRLIRVSEEVRITLEKVPDSKEPASSSNVGAANLDSIPDNDLEKKEKLTTSKLAKQLGLKTDVFIQKLIAKGYLDDSNGKPQLTESGKAAGGEFKNNRFGGYFLWPAPENKLD